MPHSPYRPPQLRGQIFRGSDATEEGLLTRNQLRTTAWRRLFRDVYADWRLEPTHALLCHAASLITPVEAAISGPSAAVLHGVPYAVRHDDQVDVTVPTKAAFGPVKGLTIHTTDLPADEITERLGLRVTTPHRTAWDAASRLDTVSAVVIIDGLLAAGAISMNDIRDIVAARGGGRGWHRAVSAFDLADGRAQSRPESTMRVRLVQAGLPRPEAQLPILVRNGLEYEGEFHGGVERMEHDRSRLNQLVSHGWIVLHATRRHLGQEFAALLRQTEAALRSRGWSRTATTPGK